MTPPGSAQCLESETRKADITAILMQTNSSVKTCVSEIYMPRLDWVSLRNKVRSKSQTMTGHDRVFADHSFMFSVDFTRQKSLSKQTNGQTDIEQAVRRFS